MAEYELLDCFAGGPTSNFDPATHILWNQSQRIAAERGHSKVFPWFFFEAWLASVEHPAFAVDAKAFSHLIQKKVGRPRQGLTTSNATEIAPEIVLANAFSLGQADCIRFSTQETVAYSWVIPNLLDSDLVIASSMRDSGINLREYLKSVLASLGEPFPKLIGHYVVRLRMIPSRI
jgi:hypothetical protein